MLTYLQLMYWEPWPNGHEIDHFSVNCTQIIDQKLETIEAMLQSVRTPKVVYICEFMVDLVRSVLRNMLHWKRLGSQGAEGSLLGLSWC